MKPGHLPYQQQHRQKDTVGVISELTLLLHLLAPCTVAKPDFHYCLLYMEHGTLGKPLIVCPWGSALKTYLLFFFVILEIYI